jgi:hypothetical protein
MDEEMKIDGGSRDGKFGGCEARLCLVIDLSVLSLVAIGAVSVTNILSDNVREGGAEAAVAELVCSPAPYAACSQLDRYITAIEYTIHVRCFNAFQVSSHWLVVPLSISYKMSEAKSITRTESIN